MTLSRDRLDHDRCSGAAGHPPPRRRLRMRRNRALLTTCAVVGLVVCCLMTQTTISVVNFMGKRKSEPNLSRFPEVPTYVWILILLGSLALCVYAYLELKARKFRALKRPYKIEDSSTIEKLPDPLHNLEQVVSYVQEVIIQPIDVRLPGRPFEFDLHSFPFTPMVLVIGNHSSGKSTFINRMLGVQVQETGVAPTDDGFTILERSSGPGDEIEDGPTVLGCPENKPFRELQRFGQGFSGSLRRKRLELPPKTQMPYGLQIVDTPGMIDLPANIPENFAKGRSYNFVEVVRWWAKRADLILLLFDPDKPGTTGETLEVLTKSLSGLDHKFLVILNKVDQLDNCVDFARAYGTLGWALSKVIPRKDIPQIYTMYNAGFDGKHHSLPLESFAKKRGEVLEEVMRAKVRHNDNLVTSLEETLRRIQMIAIVLESIRTAAKRRAMLMYTLAFLLVATPVGLTGKLLFDGRLVVPSNSVCVGILVLLLLAILIMMAFLREYLRQFNNLLATQVDDVFEKVHHQFFIHDEGESYRLHWQVVRPKILNILGSVKSVDLLPSIPRWEADRINEVLEKDVWYLRQLARRLRTPMGRV
eukprot:TRINITY_DN15966_c0_g1_i1.p1 TRINITY_DN15966_c0_g1~~TRINITY_DN15966_c0_g1_i1.p1  ORF type:complete len:588 (-),score=97.84 TRINITY_DN15966_c0_g1_i1:168-1931(-)